MKERRRDGEVSVFALVERGEKTQMCHKVTPQRKYIISMYVFLCAHVCVCVSMSLPRTNRISGSPTPEHAIYCKAASHQPRRHIPNVCVCRLKMSRDATAMNIWSSEDQTFRF